MELVVGISFKDNGRIYYFSPNGLELSRQQTVVVETERGLQYGIVQTEVKEIADNKLNGPLKKVLRISNKNDYKNFTNNQIDAKEALKKCRELVEKHGLKMKIIDANFTLNREQLLFHFLSDGRVDFRKLAKDLASTYRTRIELRQVGVRDKAKEIGGVGTCGKVLCCAQFLNDFDSVSINMVKNQNLSLNPNKINGACGRLLCCLKYEDDCYRKCRQNLPKVGDKAKTEQGEGLVSSVKILEQSYKVEIPNIGTIEVKQ